MPDQHQRKPMTEEEAKEIASNPLKPFAGRPFFPNQENNSRDYSEEIDRLTEKIESLESLLKTIFDGHILINGQFMKITP